MKKRILSILLVAALAANSYRKRNNLVKYKKLLLAAFYILYHILSFHFIKSYPDASHNSLIIIQAIRYYIII